MATLGCGLSTCTVTATGDGRATINVTAASSAWSTVTASLTNGSMSLQNRLLWRNTAHPRLAHAAALAGRRSYLYLDGAGAGRSQRPPAPTRPSPGRPPLGISTQGSGAAVTNANGVAAKILTVGPLAEGQTATISACLNGTSQCVVYTAFGARTEYGWLQPVSGVAQTLDTSTAPAPIVLRLLDNLGNPMAGGAVALYQSLTAFTPPCTPHAVCVPGAQLATQTATATSDIDGVVSFSPLTLPGVATNMAGLAATGSTSTVAVAVQQHP